MHRPDDRAELGAALARGPAPRRPGARWSRTSTIRASWRRASWATRARDAVAYGPGRGRAGPRVLRLRRQVPLGREPARSPQADLEPDLAADIRAAAVEVYLAIGACGFARVDMLLSADGIPFISEINTIPGFTPISLFPRMTAQGGYDFGGTCERIVELALERAAGRPAPHGSRRATCRDPLRAAGHGGRRHRAARRAPRPSGPSGHAALARLAGRRRHGRADGGRSTGCSPTPRFRVTEASVTVEGLRYADEAAVRDHLRGPGALAQRLPRAGLGDRRRPAGAAARWPPRRATVTLPASVSVARRGARAHLRLERRRDGLAGRSRRACSSRRSRAVGGRRRRAEATALGRGGGLDAGAGRPSARRPWMRTARRTAGGPAPPRRRGGAAVRRPPRRPARRRGLRLLGHRRPRHATCRPSTSPSCASCWP